MQGLHRNLMILSKLDNSSKRNLSDEEESHSLDFKAILLSTILVLYILASHIIEKYKIKFLHESSLSILFGIISSFILHMISGQQVYFDEQLFFSLILPPIILAAGYSLRKKYFIQNFGLIQFYGIIGTVISFFIIATFSVLLNEWQIFGQKLPIQDILLLASVLCATDTVAVLNLVKEQEYPLLNSILFGEGIMNDAIAIVIFRSVINISSSEDTEFNFDEFLYIAGYFIYLFFLSVLIGLIFGLSISYFFKKHESFNHHPIKETALIYLVSYLAYLLSEILELSGIISLFVCGVVMGQYTYQNISQESQKGTVLVFDSIAYCSEAFVFCYLGMSIYNMDSTQIPILFCIIIMFVICLARFFATFLLPCIKFILGFEQALKIKELKVFWYSGLIRGAIAFAMVLQIKSENKSVLVNAVLVIVVFTITILSSLLQVFSGYVGLQYTQEEEMIKKIYENDEQGELSTFNSIGNYPEDKNKSQNKFQQKLSNFEEHYLRPVFTKGKDQNMQEISLMEFQSSELKKSIFK